MKKYDKFLILGFILLGFRLTGFSQELTPYKLTLEQALDLGLKNHQQLKISQARLESSRQQVDVTKLQRLPSITFSANAFYLGDALVLDKDWSKVTSVDMPHFGNTFGLEASQLLFKGGIIRKSIEMAELQQQLAELNLVSNEQDIKFLIISNYLDVCKLINQLHVLEQNKILAEQLLANITKMSDEKMVTRNELIRAELQIKNLNQTVLTLKNNHAILSNQLDYALGLADSLLIIPNESFDTNKIVQTKAYYTDLAHKQHPALRLAEMNVEIANKSFDIQKANWYPALAAFGGYNMQRPITSTTPVVDMYSNSWEVGFSLSYSIDNLYKNSRKVKLSKSQKNVAKESQVYAQQNIESGLNSAYLKYQEAEQQVILMDESKKLANENYEIVRNKYLNQLAITAEMTDASNAKLRAELEYTNAIINRLFQYYNLLRATGTL